MHSSYLDGDHWERFGTEVCVYELFSENLIHVSFYLRINVYGYSFSMTIFNVHAQDTFESLL